MRRVRVDSRRYRRASHRSSPPAARLSRNRRKPRDRRSANRSRRSGVASPAGREIPPCSGECALRSRATSRAPAIASRSSSGGSRADLRRDFPSPIFLPSQQFGLAQGDPDAVVLDPEIARCFRDAIRVQIFCGAGLDPAGLQHHRRTHQHSAAPVKPFRVFPRRREAGLIHQRDLPAKIDRVAVALLQFLPGRDRPVAPGRDDVEVVGHGKSHGAYMTYPTALRKGQTALS